MSQVSEVTKIRRQVLAEICRLAFAGELEANIRGLLTKVVTDAGPRYRCCIHKERAVLKDRVNMALSQPIGTDLAAAARAALAGKREAPVLKVLPEACDRCPIDKFMVTDACRNCVAHNCIASCPKQAITVVQNRAYIDKLKCVECGLCKRSCNYGAIIEISRPCERACELGAITAGSDRRAVIDREKCVQCGACMVACPFGAISDSSEIVQLIREIRRNRRVYALLAPAFIGQFGPRVSPEAVAAALKKLGFYQVREVAFGADMVALEEAREFLATVPGERQYMTTSCCPAFVALIEKHLPELKDNVSTAVSPMVAAARLIKAEDPEALTVFIGPCVAKKAEAQQYPDAIDYVLTFEELDAMLTGADIDIAAAAEGDFVTTASRDGIAFGRAGGVAGALGAALAQVAPETELKACSADGLANCKAALQKLRHGCPEINFLEGMACPGGCVGGPGALGDPRVTARLLDNFSRSAARAAAPENAEAAKAAQSVHCHREATLFKRE